MPRTRLFEQLDQGRERRLTWIAAPPGAGKTTLVCSYLDARKLPCLWYQIDAGDSDLAAFFHHLGLAVARAAPRFRRAMPKLTPEYLAGIPTFTRNFFRELARRLNQQHLLVFDNLQEVDPSAPLYEVLCEGLSELPANLHGVLISRTNPAPNFARMRVSGQLAELDWDAMRLRPEETRQFLERLDNHVTLPLDVVTRLHEQSAGWVAGLILLHEGVTEATPGQPVFDAASAQHLFDYFATEVFARRQPVVQELLMLTALLPSFTATLAQRISGHTRAAVWLDDLVQSHHFTERRSGTGADYQYHPLFQSFLLGQAHKNWGAAELARRRHRAAILLEEAGRAEEALALYLDTEDWNAATRLILEHAPTIMAAGRFLTLGAALGKLPAAALEAVPWLLYWLGVCSLPMDPGAALLQFDAAFERFERDHNATGAYLAWVGAVEAIGFQMTDYRQYAPWLDRLDRLTETYPEFPNNEIEVRVLAGAILAGMWHRPGHPSFIRWLERAAILIHAGEHPVACARLAFYLLTSRFWFGNDDDAAAATGMLGRTASLMRRITEAPFEHILIRHMELTLSAIRGDADHTLALLQDGLRLSQRSAVHMMDVMLMGWGATACLAAGRLAEAGAWLQRMQERIETMSTRLDREFYWQLRAWRAALGRDFPAALQHAALCLHNQEILHSTPTLINVLLNQALYQVEMADLDAARATLVRADDLLHGTPDGFLRSQRLLVAAQLARAEQREVDACELFGQAVRLNALNHFFLLPAPLARLCALALERDIEADAARSLIRRLRLTPPDGMQPETWPWPVKVYTLGQFSLVLDGNPAKFSGKIQKKPLELLKALIALGGQDVNTEKLLDLLWPEAEGDAARRTLITTLQRLRRLLRSDVLIHQDGRLSLDTRRCWVDVWAFEQRLRGASQNPEQIKHALPLYRGSFLAQDDTPRYAVSLRERLRSQFLRAVSTVGKHLETRAQWEEAITHYESALGANDLAEECYQGLLRCHAATAQPGLVQATYERARRVLKARLGMEPSAHTENVYRKARDGYEEARDKEQDN